MEDILFVNGQIYVDDARVYQDGALLVSEGKIKEIYKDRRYYPRGYKTIDLMQAKVLPAFVKYVNIDHLRKDDYRMFSYFQSLNGYHALIATLTLDDNTPLKALSDFDPTAFEGMECLGLHVIIKSSKLPSEVFKWIESHETIISLTGDEDYIFDGQKRILPKEYHEDRKVNGYYGSFNESFSYDPLKANRLDILSAKEAYIILNEGISLQHLKLMKNFHERRRLLYDGDPKDLIASGYDFFDVVACKTLNYYRLYDQRKGQGTLIKGQKADFVLLNDQGELLASFVEGVIVA